MDFHQLRYFNSLAVLENMSKASKLLNISQSALSKSIAKLEGDIGCCLFERNGKNIKLNESGKVFMEYSFKVLDLIDEGVCMARQVDSDPENRIRICILGSDNSIVKCMNLFVKNNPAAVFTLDESVASGPIPDINYYDLIIYPDSPKYSEFEASVSKRDKFYLCVHYRHPLAAKIAVSLKDLNGLDMVFLKAGNAVESVQWGLEALSVKINKKYYVRNRNYHKQMLASGIAAGFVSEGSMPLYESDNTLRFIPVLDSRFSITMKYVFKPEEKMTEMAKKFKEAVLDYCKYSKLH